ncbi:transforming acidic coiled-coil-containing protein 3 isoform X2 [Erpetoichthys calabaricus]|uniref:transforming acidic coiled-coil-containing protein 3 isoform X2 n=1 Tax=Erpetoichthys calabaricus TaxID=27687 RepID=UPI002234CFBD|nr:transforming acidic coiled-coil-containing protein 3 isoform X2 [Erpetoichthys calabaricus]
MKRMSVSITNDENFGIDLSNNHCSLDSCEILFPQQQTGRPSILRPSQKENMLPKNVPKFTKVSFQTPLRDPVSHKIVSPSFCGRFDGSFDIDDCTKAMQLLNIHTDDLKIDRQIEAGKSIPDVSGGAALSTDKENGDQSNVDNHLLLDIPAVQPCDLNITAENMGDAKQFNQESVADKQYLEDTILFAPSLDDSVPQVEQQPESVTFLKNSNSEESVVIVKCDSSSTVSSQDVMVASCPSQELDKTEVPDLPSSSFNLCDSPLIKKGTYTLNFDDLDSVNPFKSAGSKIQNSPVAATKPPLDVSEPVNDITLNLKSMESATVELEAMSVGLDSSEFSKTAPPPKDEPVKLEFNFDDGKKATRKPPPMKLGKRPPGAKVPVTTLVAPTEKNCHKPSVAAEKMAEDVPLPKASYSLDMDKLDDPNFNPFGTGIKIGNSPKLPVNCSNKIEAANSSEVHETAIMEKPVNDVLTTEILNGPDGTQSSMMSTTDLSKLSSSSSNNRSPPLMVKAADPNKPVYLDNTINFTLTGLDITRDEAFLSPSKFSGFAEPIDYLEQFGTSTFAESALRKQSLYLKFDPLLRDSPHKSFSQPAAWSDSSLPFSVLPRCVEEQEPISKIESTQTLKPSITLNIFESLSVEQTLPVSSAPSLPPVPNDFPLATENAICDILQYTQKDLDSAIENVKHEMREKDNEVSMWQEKYNQLNTDYSQMVKIVTEFEATLAKVLDDAEKQKAAAQLEIQKLAEEKQQVLADLSSMEKSFSELFKRFEKQKEAIEGYKKNEDTLKKCAQDYLARIKKEEQRYQALKAHAEEKINFANEEIAQVRAKFKAEIAALQATLRREQVKIQSLERSLEQKTKENEELTKLCDELIMNVQKNGREK